jgi:iron complex outermembrane receptor protein
MLTVAQPGETPLKQLNLNELSQVQISATRKEPVAAFRAPAATNVMTAADIRRSGATTIPELLRLLPGLQVAQIDSSKWAIGSRGFQGRLSRSMLVMIDGRSVYTPLFAGVYWEMQDTLLEDIDRIEYIRGPGGTIWGSNAVNGVINIVTKNARQTRGMLVSAGGGNVEQGFLNWRYGGGTDDLSYRIYGKGATRGPQSHADGANYDDWRGGQTGGRLDWRPTLRDSVTIQGDIYGTEAGGKLRLNRLDPPSNPAVEENGFFSGQNVMLAWQRVLDSGADLQLRTYYDRTDRQDLHYREVRHTFDADFIHHIPFQRHEVAWGAGVRSSPSRYFQTVETVDFMPHEQTYNIASAFIQDDISVIRDRLTLGIGTKLEYNSFSGFNYQPGVRLAWTPNGQNTVWAAVTRAVRTPSRIEEGFRFTALLSNATSPPLFVRLVGDGGFDNEQLVGYEFGIRHFFEGGGFLSLSLFHNRYSDLLSVDSIPTITETSPPPTRSVIPLLLRNGVAANSSGGELASLWDLHTGVRMRASYSYLLLDAKRDATSNDASTVGQLEGDTPGHKVVVQTLLDLPWKLEFDAAYRFVSAIPNQKVPRYSTVDARLGRSFGNGFEVSVVARNLVEPSHVEYGGNPGALVGIKRSAFVKLSWSR